MVQTQTSITIHNVKMTSNDLNRLQKKLLHPLKNYKIVLKGGSMHAIVEFNDEKLDEILHNNN